MSTEFQLSPHVTQWIVQALTRLFATFGLIQGFFIILGGDARWRTPALAVAMLVPGAPATWGVVIGTAGALALAGTFLAQLRLTAYALLGIGAWCIFFAMTIAVAIVRDNRIATTGFWTYMLAGIASCTLSVAYLQSRNHQARLRSVL